MNPRKWQEIRGEPDLLALPPVAKTPLIRQGERFYLFVPGRLFEALYYAFHTRLFADEAYRPTYDRIRADWLERSAVDAFRRMLPNAEAGWGLAHGPKRQRFDLDGLIPAATDRHRLSASLVAIDNERCNSVRRGSIPVWAKGARMRLRCQNEDV